MTVCRHFQVSGHVQGVFYRAATQDIARRLGLTGWVRNRTDGDVELVACGAPVKLQELERWLHQGPPHAHVTQVRATDTDAQTYTDFSITT